MKPALIPGAFVRTYVGEVGRTWVLVFGMPARRLRLDLTDRILVENSNGRTGMSDLAELASMQLMRSVSPAEVEGRIARLVAEKALTDGESTATPQPRIDNLVSRSLDDAAVAALTLRMTDARIGCDMTGGCCRLYDRIGLSQEDVANVRAAFAEDELTPGGLTLETALRPDGFGGDDGFAIAVRDGACVLLEDDGKCSVHARLGIGRKPMGCRQYPLRDVAVGSELHVGLAVECKCIITFAETGDPPDGSELLARRRAMREVEEVAATIGANRLTRWPRADYLGWRDRALAALESEADLAVWALAEAARALEMPAPRPPAVAARALAVVIADCARYFRNQARDISEVYSKDDLELELFGWAAETMGVLEQRVLADAPDWPAPLAGERFYVKELVFSHNLLRSRTLVTGLAALGMRLLAARVGAGLRIDPRLHPLSAMEVLFRAHGASYLVDSDAWDVEDALRGE